MSMVGFKGRKNSTKGKSQKADSDRKLDLERRMGRDKVYIPSGIKGKKDFLTKQEHGDMIYKVVFLKGAIISAP